MATDEILFSFEGRLNRSTFCVFWAVTQPTAGFASFLLLKAAVSGRPEGYGLLALSVGLTVFLYGLWAGLAIYAKRWHDLGKSGLLVASYGLGPLLILWLLSPFLALGWTVPLALLVPLAAINVALLLFLVVAPGTAGPQEQP
jgi:uncharacterized membrane protein YhaH (DUF805 family)